MDSEEYSESDSSYEDISDESDSDEDTLDAARNWCRIDQENLAPPPPRFPFSGNPGLNTRMDGSSPIEFFCIFFDDDIVGYIASETNRYAEDFIEKNDLTPSSRVQKWKDVDSSEIRVFLGIIILQGIVQKPLQKWYWSQRPLLSTPYLKQLMSEKRFSIIMKFLHFTNNETIDLETHPQPGLRKVYEVYDAINRKFKSSYVPERDVSVDESLLLYKGRLGCKQYLPKKRARFGIKFYQLCEYSSGYIWNSLIYTGKDMPLWNESPKYKSTTNIVMTLLEDLIDKGYCVTLDNFYTSPELAELLLSHRTDVYGTLRPNRIGVPEEIKKGTLKKGEIIGFQKGKICVMKYMDKKPICILSTVHNTVIVEQDKKRKKTHGKSERIVSKKPQAIIDYNLTMGGVDKADQCLSYYPTVRNQQKKYYLKIFRQILNQSVWNSFVLYKKNGGTMSHLAFRLQLVEELAKIYGESKHSSQNTTSSDRLNGRHFPSHIQPTQKKKAPTKICIVCSQKFNEKGQRVRKESRYQCAQCNVTLCVTPCFEKYHTVENF
ncbi:PiggyBac transposable element-derived protein 4 [Araneus ventricosus]|uniref:PiggyBac transposable element-derived protein 4 n=1 Tax=Araneus ventricosus TaxID=182803 RepID=A0A4Y2A1S4_ARAVE|nr:PiggyBac transposable element-derived protein 4 [Araneus ventricosus]